MHQSLQKFAWVKIQFHIHTITISVCLIIPVFGPPLTFLLSIFPNCWQCIIFGIQCTVLVWIEILTWLHRLLRLFIFSFVNMYTTNINVGRMALTQSLFQVWVRCLVICGEARSYLLDLLSLYFLLLLWRICSTIDTWTSAVFNLLTFWARSIYIFHWHKFIEWEPLDGAWTYIPLLSFISPKLQWLEPLLQSLPPVVNQSVHFSHNHFWWVPDIKAIWKGLWSDEHIFAVV